MLATIEDVIAAGGVPVDVVGDEPEGVRANRLLEMASALVLVYLDQFGVTEADVDGWEPFRKSALAAIVAEIAAKRLNVSAAPNVDPYFAGASGPQTLKLNHWEQDAIRGLLPAGGHVTSAVVERDFSWVTGEL